MMKQWTTLLVFLFLSLSLSAQQEYGRDIFVSSKGDSLPYRMIHPESVKPGEKYPLVLFLHGAGERGNDNEKQLTHGGQMFLNPVNQEKYPAFVLIPQCPTDGYWAYTGRPKSLIPTEMPVGQEISPILQTLKQLLDSYLVMPEVDTQRVYIIGLSMGAMGTYDLSGDFCSCSSYLRYSQSKSAIGCQGCEISYLSRRCGRCSSGERFSRSV